jgi:hypothetical protein
MLELDNSLINHKPGSKDERTLHDIRELSYVARPGMLYQFQ